MGEYLHNVKLGTCESLYYTTYNQLKNWLVSGKENFLKVNSGYRFRFPFPDEKNRRIGDYDNFDRGYLINIPKGIFEMNHGQKWVRTDDLKINAPVMGFNIDCPTKINNARRWNYEETESFEIVQQKLVIDENSKQTELQLVLRCPYCGEMARASFDEANKIAEYLFKEAENWLKSDKNKANELKEIAETILEGYFPELIEA